MIFLDNKNTIGKDNESFWKKEASFWNNYGKIYRHLEAATPYKRMLDDIRVIIKNKNKLDWLDIGCGPGTMIDLIIEENKYYNSIRAIDFDGVMVDQAIRRLSNKENIFVELGDISKGLNFENEKFDIILANLVLSYVIIFKNQYVGVDALEHILKDVYRVLKKDGSVVWTTPVENVDFSKVFLASWRQVFNPLTPQYIYYGPRVLSYALKIQEKGKSGIYHFLKQSDLQKLMEKVGFKNIIIKKTFASQAYLISANK